MSDAPGFLIFLTVVGWIATVTLFILWAMGNASLFWPLIVTAIITFILTFILGGPSAFDLLDF